MIAAAMNPSAASTSALLTAFETHYAELIRYIARRTGNLEEARGLAHDTWLRIAERQGAAPDATPADPRAYLFTVSHNLAMNHLRRDHWMAGYLAECGQADAAAPAQAPDVADGAMYRQALAAVETALAGLAPRVRDAYLACGLHGEKQADTAARLGVSLNTVERDIGQATRCIEDALHAWRHTRPAAARSKAAGRRRSLAALLGVFAVGVSGTALWQHLQREALRWQTALTTLRGQRLQRGLPDGSELTLDAASRLEVDYDAAQRRIRLLDGAAFFAVQRDPGRPFVVQARGVQVTVLGTRFGVEIDGGQGVLVQVESGRACACSKEKCSGRTSPARPPGARVRSRSTPCRWPKRWRGWNATRPPPCAPRPPSPVCASAAPCAWPMPATGWHRCRACCRCA
jgi:RNA polymerase sigma factor (sigma-70 family)